MKTTDTKITLPDDELVRNGVPFGTFIYRVHNLRGESRVVRAFFPKTARDISGYGDAVLRIDGPLGVGIWPELGRLLMGGDLPNQS